VVGAKAIFALCAGSVLWLVLRRSSVWIDTWAEDTAGARDL